MTFKNLENIHLDSIDRKINPHVPHLDLLMCSWSSLAPNLYMLCVHNRCTLPFVPYLPR